jgi:signal transduction histidine kinase
LADIRRFAPRPIRKRRGLIDAGGLLLKSLICTATTGDPDKLHAAIADLHRSQDHVAHAVDQHVTYYRHLSDTLTTDHQALIDLSASIRQVAENTRDNFQEIDTKFDLVAKVKETATGIQKLEFALLRLEICVDEYVSALQQALLNKLPVNIISPVMLGNILRNVSLTISETYALAADPAPQGLMWYYQNVQSSLITTLHGFLLVQA